MGARIALLVAGTAVAGFVLAGGAGAAGPAGDPARGAQVFTQTACGACHALRAAGAAGKIGPSLDTTKPTYERALTVIADGLGGMPKFSGDLTAQQIADVAAYVVQATGGQLPAAPAPSPVTAPGPGEPAPVTTPAPGATPLAGEGATSVVRVDLKARRLVLEPRRAAAGRVTFVVRNPGRRAHSLVVLRTRRALGALPTRGQRVREVGRIGGMGLPARRLRRLTLKLEPGRYVVLSNRAGDYRRGLRALLVVAGSASTAPPQAAPPPALPPAPTPISEPTFPPPALDARRLFVTTCGGCHTLRAAGTSGVSGPNLDHERPSCESVAKVVRSGDDEMPSFRDAFTDQQIRDIAAYVAQATGRGGCGRSGDSGGGDSDGDDDDGDDDD